MSPGCSPKTDGSPELSAEEGTCYQSLTGILHWIVEMRRIDVRTEFLAMSSYVAMPREGHLLQVFHIFAHLRISHNARTVFDPTYPEIDEGMYVK